MAMSKPDIDTHREMLEEYRLVAASEQSVLIIQPYKRVFDDGKGRERSATQAGTGFPKYDKKSNVEQRSIFSIFLGNWTQDPRRNV